MIDGDYVDSQQLEKVIVKKKTVSKAKPPGGGFRKYP